MNYKIVKANKISKINKMYCGQVELFKCLTSLKLTGVTYILPLVF